MDCNWLGSHRPETDDDDDDYYQRQPLKKVLALTEKIQNNKIKK